MASETGAVREHTIGASNWLYGAIGGLVGTAVFGLLHQFVIPGPVLSVVVPALYGIEGPALSIGWAFHVFHGIVIGLIYVALVEFGGLSRAAGRLKSSVGLGIAYGILTTIGFSVIVLPLWLSGVGFPMAPPFPNISVPGTIVSLIGHTIYAVLLATTYAVLKR